MDQWSGRANEPHDQGGHRQALHYDSHDQLKAHLADFMAAYIFARRLKTLSGLTPYEYICKIWTSEPDRFILNPIHQMPRLKNLDRPVETGCRLQPPGSRLRSAGRSRSSCHRLSIDQGLRRADAHRFMSIRTSWRHSITIITSATRKMVMAQSAPTNRGRVHPRQVTGLGDDEAAVAKDQP